MRILVTGASGFLGWNLARHLLGEGEDEVFGTSLEHPAPAGLRTWRMDLKSPESILSTVRDCRPDVMIHTAALSRGDICEAHPERARLVNAEPVRRIGDALATLGAHLIYCSTDLVFDGLNAPYSEEDVPAPRMVYGRSKAEGEAESLAANCPSAVARLALMFGEGSPASGSFLRWMDAGLRGASGVTMFEDEFRSALYVRDAVDGLLRIARQKTTGIYHLAGPERLSRYEFAVRYARSFELDPGRVHPARQADAGGPIFRPPDVSLDISKARRELGFNPRAAQEAFQELKKAQSG